MCYTLFPLLTVGKLIPTLKKTHYYGLVLSRILFTVYYPTFGKRGIPNSRKASTYFVIDDLHFHSMPAVTVQSNGRVSQKSDGPINNYS